MTHGIQYLEDKNHLGTFTCLPCINRPDSFGYVIKIVARVDIDTHPATKTLTNDVICSKS